MTSRTLHGGDFSSVLGPCSTRACHPSLSASSKPRWDLARCTLGHSWHPTDYVLNPPRFVLRCSRFNGTAIRPNRDAYRPVMLSSPVQMLAKEESLFPTMYANLRRALVPLMDDDAYAAMGKTSSEVSVHMRIPGYVFVLLSCSCVPTGKTSGGCCCCCCCVCCGVSVVFVAAATDVALSLLLNLLLLLLPPLLLPMPLLPLQLPVVLAVVVGRECLMLHPVVCMLLLLMRV